MIPRMKTHEMSKQRRAFDASFRLQVVQMIRQEGLSVSQVCRVM
jgi:transposase